MALVPAAKVYVTAEFAWPGNTRGTLHARSGNTSTGTWPGTGRRSDVSAGVDPDQASASVALAMLTAARDSVLPSSTSGLWDRPSGRSPSRRPKESGLDASFLPAVAAKLAMQAPDLGMGAAAMHV